MVFMSSRCVCWRRRGCYVQVLLGASVFGAVLSASLLSVCSLFLFWGAFFFLIYWSFSHALPLLPFYYLLHAGFSLCCPWYYSPDCASRICPDKKFMCITLCSCGVQLFTSCCIIQCYKLHNAIISDPQGIGNCVCSTFTILSKATFIFVLWRRG